MDSGKISNGKAGPRKYRSKVCGFSSREGTG